MRTQAMTSSSGTVLSRAETVALIARLTESIYLAHIHSGKSYLSMTQAIQLAATTIGAVQSEMIAGFVEAATADPEGSLRNLSGQRKLLNKRVDDDQKTKINQLAHAIERERNCSEKDGAD